jgi:hypothetical protein
LPVGKRDMQIIEGLVNEYCNHFGGDPKETLKANSEKFCHYQREHTKTTATKAYFLFGANNVLLIFIAEIAIVATSITATP